MRISCVEGENRGFSVEDQVPWFVARPRWQSVANFEGSGWALGFALRFALEKCDSSSKLVVVKRAQKEE